MAENLQELDDLLVLIENELLQERMSRQEDQLSLAVQEVKFVVSLSDVGRGEELFDVVYNAQNLGPIPAEMIGNAIERASDMNIEDDFLLPAIDEVRSTGKIVIVGGGAYERDGIWGIQRATPEKIEKYGPDHGFELAATVG